MHRYWVVYEDGDTEEMTWPEVMENSPTWLPGGWDLLHCDAVGTQGTAYWQHS
jgi:hypothetical protein